MWGCAATCCKVPDSSRSLALSSRTRQSRSSPARLRESRPTLAPIWNWKHARRRRRESNSSRCATGSSMARAPSTRATAIWAIRLGNGKFRLLARDTASPASCISTMRPERPPPRWSVRWARTTSSTETRRLSTCSFARATGAPAPPRLSEEDALRTLGPDTVYYATRLRGASNEKAQRELGFRPRPLEWI